MVMDDAIRCRVVKSGQSKRLRLGTGSLRRAFSMKRVAFQSPESGAWLGSFFEHGIVRRSTSRTETRTIRWNAKLIRQAQQSEQQSNPENVEVRSRDKRSMSSATHYLQHHQRKTSSLATVNKRTHRVLDVLT